jgi:hypothetical protein
MDQKTLENALNQDAAQKAAQADRAERMSLPDAVIRLESQQVVTAKALVLLQLEAVQSFVMLAAKQDTTPEQADKYLALAQTCVAMAGRIDALGDRALTRQVEAKKL